MTLDSAPELARRVLHLEMELKRNKPAAGTDNAALLKRISALESSVARLSKATPTKPQVYTPKPTATVPKPADNSLTLKVSALEREVERLKVKESPGAWLDWTPTWTAATTNPDIGNGTLKGRYCKVGKMVTFSISLEFGSTTTAGLGRWAFSLPAGSNTSSIRNNGVCTYWDGSLGDSGSGVAMLQEGGTQLNTFYIGGSYMINSVSPITWANLDQLYITMTYEVA